MGSSELPDVSRADLYRRHGQAREAIEAYQQALKFAQQEPERRFIQTRLQELKSSSESTASEGFIGTVS